MEVIFVDVAIRGTGFHVAEFLGFARKAAERHGFHLEYVNDRWRRRGRLVTLETNRVGRGWLNAAGYEIVETRGWAKGVWNQSDE